MAFRSLQSLPSIPPANQLLADPLHAQEQRDSPSTYSKSFLIHRFSSSPHQKADLRAWWEGRSPWKGNRKMRHGVTIVLARLPPI